MLGKLYCLTYLDGVGEQLTRWGHMLGEVVLVIVVGLPVVIRHLLFRFKKNCVSLFKFFKLC